MRVWANKIKEEFRGIVFTSFPKSLTALLLLVRPGKESTAMSLAPSGSGVLLFLDHILKNLFMLPDLDDDELACLRRETLGKIFRYESLSHRMKSMQDRAMVQGLFSDSAGYSKNTELYMSGVNVFLFSGEIGGLLNSEIVDKLLFPTFVQR